MKERRKRLLKSQRILPISTKLDRIKQLNKEIKSHYHKIKLKNVRRSIFPGNTASLWTAVKIAKDVNLSTLPKTLYEKTAL